MNKFNKALFYKAFLLSVLCQYFLFQNLPASEQLAHKGIFDLSYYDFSKSGTVKLNGEWEFYQGKYYLPEDFASRKIIHPAFVHVPNNWTNYVINKTDMPSFGYATFRLSIIFDSTFLSQGKVFSIKMPGIFSAYKLWIDTNLVFQQGNPGSNLNEHYPRVATSIIPFLIPRDTTTIIIHVANYYSNMYAGIRNPIIFGIHNQVTTQSRKIEFWYFGGAVFCFTLGIYFFFLFLLKHERKINILFAITCFIMGIRYLLDVEYVILLFYPEMSSSLVHRILCLCLNISPIILWSAYLFFPREINKRVLQFTFILYFFYSIAVIIIPVSSYGYLINIFIILTTLILIYISAASGFAYHNKRESAGIFFFGMLVTPGFFIYNMFAESSPIPIGGLLYLILQALTITSKFVHSHKRVLKLSEDLQLMNENLELLVVERTKELNIVNETLKKLNFAKDRFISILSHDLRNPLNSLIGLSRRLFSNADKNNREKVVSYSKMINESAITCHTLAENLLDWSLIQSGTKSIIPKKIKVKETVDNVFDLLKSEAVLKNIELINSVTIDCEVYADTRMTESILRNLITNGIKFTNRNGKVEVSSFRNDSIWNIKVSDSGIGMEDDMLKDLFRIDRKVYNLGTEDEPGSGFGLILTKEFVKSNGGTMSVRSEKGKGTVVTFSLPANKSSISSEIME